MSQTVIIGCGISGLYVTYLLLKDGVDANTITIVAKHTPGDLSHDYASPYAGATVNAVEDDDKQVQFNYKYTFEELSKLRDVLGGVELSGIADTTNIECWKEKPSDSCILFFKSYNKTVRELETSELYDGATFGMEYTSYVINSPVLIQSIYDYVQSKGVKVVIKKINHISEVMDENTKTVFNCTGLGSLKLGGVEDSTCYPTRAQVVVIRAPHISGVKMFWGDQSNYMIKRPSDQHEVILGGFYQEKNWNRDVLGYETKDILERTTKYFPILKPGQTIDDIDILRVVSAFRPGRADGARVEREEIGGVELIHNYGIEGCGYVQGLGLAERAIGLRRK